MVKRLAMRVRKTPLNHSSIISGGIAAAVALMGVVNGAAASSGVVYDDAAVSREFVYAKGFFCGNDRPIKSSLNWILTTCCGNDTNRGAEGLTPLIRSI